MLLFAVVAALLSIGLASSQGAKCFYADPVTNTTFDLSALVGEVYAVDGEIYTYDVSVCANLKAECANGLASICQNDSHRAPHEYIVQVWDDSAQWSLIQPGNVSAGVQVVMNNGGPCYPTNKPRWSSIQFVCSTNSNEMMMLSEAPPAPCNATPGYTFRLATPHACAIAPPPCVWFESSPCVVKEFSVSTGGGPNYGAGIVFNAQSNLCGAVYFVTGDVPYDICGSVIISYYPFTQLSQIVQLLQQSTNTLFFYDPQTRQSILEFDGQSITFKR